MGIKQGIERAKDGFAYIGKGIFWGVLYPPLAVLCIVIGMVTWLPMKIFLGWTLLDDK